MVEIRELTSEDFDNTELIESLLELDMVGLKTVAALKEVFEKRKPITETFIAVIENKIVGMASIVIHHSFTGRNLGVPMDMYVLPEYRRQGIGRLLIKRFTVSMDPSKVSRIFGPVGRDLVPMYREFCYEVKDVVYMEKKPWKLM